MKYTQSEIDTACMLLSARACGTGLARAWLYLTGEWPWETLQTSETYRLAQNAFTIVYINDSAGTDATIIAAEAEARLRCGWLP